MRKTMTGSLMLQLWAMVMALGLSFGAAAQTSSADSAVAVAEQWLTLADANQGGLMWDVSHQIMRDQETRTKWVNHIAAKTNTLGGRSVPRAWSFIEHEQIVNKPGVPPGEYATVTFISTYGQSRGWEKVSLYMSSGRWIPAGYLYGTLAPGASPPR